MEATSAERAGQPNLSLQEFLITARHLRTESSTVQCAFDQSSANRNHAKKAIPATTLEGHVIVNHSGYNSHIFLHSAALMTDWNRINIRDAYDADVVYHIDTQVRLRYTRLSLDLVSCTQELIFDYAFQQLGIDTSTITHPIVLTETVCNPFTARRRKILNTPRHEAD